MHMKMKRMILLGTILIVGCLTGSDLMAADEKKVESKAKVLRHVVLFKFKDEVSKKQIQEVVDAFAALPKKIDTIVDFEMGTDVSVENKSKGLTHGFVVTFKNEKGRDTYLPHPAHKEFVKLVGPRLDDVLVFDFWASK
jgi:hypothetical protein